MVCYVKKNYEKDSYIILNTKERIVTTREELLNGLGEAINIIRQLAGVQEKLNNVRSSYRNTRPTKRFNLIGIVGLIITGFWGLFSLLGFMLGDIFVGIGFLLFLVLPHYLVFNHFNKKINKRINEENKKIVARNEQLKIQEQSILTELQQIQIIYRESIGQWYPENYCSLDAAEFFYNVINNYRADSIKEAINLYETHMHQQRVENNQQQAIKQQKLNNLLAAGSLVMQGATLGAINDQTNAINQQTSAIRGVGNSVNKVNDTLNKIRGVW